MRFLPRGSGHCRGRVSFSNTEADAHWYLQAGDAACGVIAHLLDAAGVNDSRHIVNGDGRLCHIGRHHDLWNKTSKTRNTASEQPLGHIRRVISSDCTGVPSGI